MGIFNSLDEHNSSSDITALSIKEYDDFDISLKYINSLRSYHPSKHYFELLIVEKGELKILSGDETVTAASRSVALIFPGGGSRISTSDPSHDLAFYSLNISPYLLTEFCNLVSYKALDTLLSECGNHIFRMNFRDFEYFVHLAEITVSSDPEKAKILAKRAGYNLISQLILSNEQKNEYPDWFELFLERINNPECFLSPISEIYKLSPYSRPILNSCFDRFMGDTLISYINKLKINYACNLLRFSDLTVLEISEKTKYTSLTNFSRVFKKQKGMSPSEYRKNNSEATSDF